MVQWGRLATVPHKVEQGQCPPTFWPEWHRTTTRITGETTDFFLCLTDGCRCLLLLRISLHPTLALYVLSAQNNGTLPPFPSYMITKPPHGVLPCDKGNPCSRSYTQMEAIPHCSRQDISAGSPMHTALCAFRTYFWVYNTGVCLHSCVPSPQP